MLIGLFALSGTWPTYSILETCHHCHCTLCSCPASFCTWSYDAVKCSQKLIVNPLHRTKQQKREELCGRTHARTHTHTRLMAFFSGTTQVSQCRKCKTNLDFTKARDSEWQWHQLGHMQVCISLQTDNHASTDLLLVVSQLQFFTGRMPFLPLNRQCQSTEGRSTEGRTINKNHVCREVMLAAKVHIACLVN